MTMRTAVWSTLAMIADQSGKAIEVRINNLIRLIEGTKRLGGKRVNLVIGGGAGLVGPCRTTAKKHGRPNVTPSPTSALASVSLPTVTSLSHVPRCLVSCDSVQDTLKGWRGQW